MPRYGDLEHVEKFVSDMINRSEIGYAGVQILSELYAMPTADVAPVVHGRWVCLFSDDMSAKVVDGAVQECCKCSVCDEYLVGSEEYQVIGLYCPNCGAKMDLEVQDEVSKETCCN